MAALKFKEDAISGQFTLYSPLQPRLIALAFGLFWLGVIGFFLVLILNDDRNGLNFLIFLFFFAGMPALSSLFTALTDATVVVDRNAQTISMTKLLLALPYSTQTLAFNDVAKFEMQHMQAKSRTSWMLYAIGRNDQRMLVNWNGTQEEIRILADEISTIVGAPVASGAFQLPVALERMIEKIEPNAKQLMEQAQASQDSPLTQANTLPVDSTPAPTMIDDASTSDASSTIALNSLSIQSLEQRIVSDNMDSDARYVLAKKYHFSGQLNKATELYQETLRLDPTNANAQNDSGVALQQRGKRAEAETAYRRAIALDPFSMTGHLNLGLLLRSLNRAADASQEFYQARQNARGDAETRMAEAASTGAKIDPQMSKT